MGALKMMGVEEQSLQRKAKETQRSSARDKGLDDGSFHPKSQASALIQSENH